MSTEYPYRTEPTHKVGTTTTGTRSTTTLDSAGVLKLDVADKINLLKPNDHPFVSYLTNVGKGSPSTIIGKKSCTQPKFEGIEDAYSGVWAKESGSYASSGAITITVTGAGTQPAYIFTVGNLVKNTRTDEVMKVATVPTATTITIAATGRSYGTSAAAAGADGDDLLIIGNVNEEGGDTPNVNTTVSEKSYNYTQIFKKSVSITNTANASDTYGQNDLSYQLMKAANDHLKSIERQFLFGERKVTTGTNGQPERATGGIKEHIEGSDAYVQDQDGVLTSADFDLFLRRGYTYGSQSKLLMCGGNIFGAINEFAKSDLQTTVGADTYGVKVHKYVSAFGDVNLVRNPEFVREYAGLGFLLDMNSYKYRFLGGRDTTLLTNRQANGIDGRVDEYRTECGLERNEASNNAILKNVL